MTLLIHAAATWFMTGLIWFVQVVHYPLYAKAGREGFAAYESSHSALTTLVVAPVMLIEALTGLGLLFQKPPEAPAWALLAGALLLAVIWGSTAFLQIPEHGILSLGFDATSHRRLVSTNWIRTAAWSARGVLVLWILSRSAAR
jgi:hypothetical protein